MNISFFIFKYRLLFKINSFISKCKGILEAKKFYAIFRYRCWKRKYSSEKTISILNRFLRVYNFRKSKRDKDFQKMLIYGVAKVSEKTQLQQHEVKDIIMRILK